jgi:hypothetical protein
MTINLVSLVACLVGAFAAESKPDVVRVERAGDCTAVVGQAVHFVFRYDGFAGQIITGLEVSLDGKQVKEPKVEFRSDPKQADVGQVAFVFLPEKAGTYRVRVTPLAGTAKGRPREYLLKVSPKK